MANLPLKLKMERLTHRASIEALLLVYGVNVDVLVGEPSEARDAEARHASRLLLELAEGFHPGPVKDWKDLCGV